MLQKTSLLWIGHRDELASLASPISEQFPDITCQFTDNVAESLEPIAATHVDLVIFHWKTKSDRPSFDALVVPVQSAQYRLPVIVLTDIPDSRIVFHTLQAGAVDCLGRPFDITRLLFLTGACTARAVCNRDGTSPAARSEDDAPVFLQSPTMRNLMESLQMAARSNSTILLMGETGTGKNRLANYVHKLSIRRHEPFVTVDCGASSESLIESELFGHVRGAFTGADQNHVGKLERAGRGTVLLDEVDCLPQRCQTRLLRVLEERVFEKVGGERTRRFEGRVIALTNQSLSNEVAEGRFRKDLYYRLSVIAFTVPPLREHPIDVPPLAQHFVERLSVGQTTNKVLSDGALAALARHEWLGNVRELRNVLECGIALCDSSVIEPQHLHLFRADHASSAEPPDVDARRLPSVRREAERTELLRVLEANNNNRTRAAQNLGISRSAFYKRLAVLGIS